VPPVTPGPQPAPVASSSWEAALADIAARAGIDHKYVESAIAATLGTTPIPETPSWRSAIPVTPVVPTTPTAPVTPVPPAPVVPDFLAAPSTPWSQPPDDLMAGLSSVYSAPGLGVPPPPPLPDIQPVVPTWQPPAIATPVVPVESPVPPADLPDVSKPAPTPAAVASPVISLGLPAEEAATVQFERPTFDKSIDKPASSLPSARTKLGRKLDHLGKAEPVSKPEPAAEPGDAFFGPVPAELAPSEADTETTADLIEKAPEPEQVEKKPRVRNAGKKPKTAAAATTDEGDGDAGTDGESDEDEALADSDGKAKKSRKSQLPGPAQWAIEIAIWVVAALILSTLIRLFVVQLFVVPSGSMENTLMTGDRIAALKYAQFQRGDIIVFSDPGGWLPGPVPQINPVHRFFEKIGLLASTDEQYLTKRVIGLPGDRVQCCSNGHLTVNGVPIDETSYLKDPTQAASSFQFDVTVPAGRLFVLGDNRNDSADSRWHLCEANSQGLGMNGFVPIQDVVGPVRSVVLPFSRIGHRATPESVFSAVPAGTDPPPTVAKVAVGVGGPNGVCHS